MVLKRETLPINTDQISDRTSLNAEEVRKDKGYIDLKLHIFGGCLDKLLMLAAPVHQESI
jgi:hypothetical protein